MHIPRIVIAGTNSGCGKTTATIGILGALVKRGLKVKPFKIGPDYIDPMFHTFITGIESRNLDSWLLDEEIVSHLLYKNAQGADIAVIEGVMGMFDGYGGYSDAGSTAHVSKVINSPVILVMNGEGLSLSAVALVRGFKDFDKDVGLRGIILNNIKSESHYLLLKEVIEENTGVLVVGYLPKMPEISLQSRHLGLIPSSEIEDLKEKISQLSTQVEKTVNLDLLIKLAVSADELAVRDLNFNIARRKSNLKIAVAKDKAFNFYYKDNLDLFEMMGAELLYFSPLEDKQLPEGADGLYIGGGYPEVFGEQLGENKSMLQSLKSCIINGLPAYAECGGLMYLSESIKDKAGKVFEMAGAIPGKSEMTPSLQRFGYVDIEVLNDNVLSKKGYRIRAHEFHYSNTTVDWNVPVCYKVSKTKKGMEHVGWHCGFKLHNLLAGYPHIHFWGNTGFAERFVNNCIQYSILGNGDLSYEGQMYNDPGHSIISREKPNRSRILQGI